MPVSIVTSLLLWSALLQPGATAEPSRSVQANPAVDGACSSSRFLDALETVRACPLDEGYSWAISEADTQEEESGDGDGDRVFSSTHWSPRRTIGQRVGMTAQPGSRIARSAERSPILRC